MEEVTHKNFGRKKVRARLNEALLPGFWQRQQERKAKKLEWREKQLPVRSKIKRDVEERKKTRFRIADIRNHGPQHSTTSQDLHMYSELFQW